MGTEVNYANLTYAELREIAGQRDIPGRSSMDHDELVAALEADDEQAANAPNDGDDADPGTMDSVQEAEAERVEHDAPLQAAGESPDISVAVEPGMPGPNPPRSAAVDPDAKYTAEG